MNHRALRPPLRLLRRIRRVYGYHLPLIAAVFAAKKVPLTYPLLRGRQKHAVLNLTDRCCFSCTMCAMPAADERRELSTDEWKDALAQLAAAGCTEVTISGGEPLMRADIAGIIDCARGKHLAVNLITNGFFLTQEHAAHWARAGVSSVALSFDADAQTFRRTRRTDTGYERMRTACALLKEHHERGALNVVLAFTLTAETAPKIEQTLSFAAEAGLPLVINLFDTTPYFFRNTAAQALTPTVAQQRSVQKQLLMFKQEHPHLLAHGYTDIAFIRSYFSDPRQRALPCTASQLRLCIGPYGDVYGGCWSLSPLGSLRNTTLDTIMRASAYRDAQRRMFYRECPGCSCGYRTNLMTWLTSLCAEAGYRIAAKKRSRIPLDEGT